MMSRTYSAEFLKQIEGLKTFCASFAKSFFSHIYFKSTNCRTLFFISDPLNSLFSYTIVFIENAFRKKFYK